LSLSNDECVLAATTCACFNLRKAVRIASQRYDEALRPAGLRSTQFVMLLAIRMLGTGTMGQLAELIVTDPTTLSRNLAPLVRRKFVARVVGKDQRSRLMTLTPHGHEVLVKAYPCWQRAQREVAAAVGTPRLAQLLDGLGWFVERAGAKGPRGA
jgi:DNA-binding MarR family transcriptional regulator